MRSSLPSSRCASAVASSSTVRYDDLRQKYGASELARVDRALSGYLRDWDATPADERQRPKFFFFPGPAQHAVPRPRPAAVGARSCARPSRRSAPRRCASLEEDRRLPNFVPDTARVEDYVGGDGRGTVVGGVLLLPARRTLRRQPSALPRHQRGRSSRSSCAGSPSRRPEILFSVLKPGSHINAHHGVTQRAPGHAPAPRRAARLRAQPRRSRRAPVAGRAAGDVRRHVPPRGLESLRPDPHRAADGLLESAPDRRSKSWPSSS